jgi:hypothetical protein
MFYFCPQVKEGSFLFVKLTKNDLLLISYNLSLLLFVMGFLKLITCVFQKGCISLHIVSPYSVGE